MESWSLTTVLKIPIINRCESSLKDVRVIRIAANEDLDRIITAWMAGQTYANLPWVVQIALLSREVFSSAIVTYELETGDTSRFRPLLVNKILSASQDVPQNFFGLADLLDSSWKSMIPSDGVLSAALLEVRSIPLSRLQQMPLLFTLGSAMELATLPPETRLSKPGQAAIALCHTHIDTISRTTDARELVTTIVEETARDCLAMMSRR